MEFMLYLFLSIRNNIEMYYKHQHFQLRGLSSVHNISQKEKNMTVIPSIYNCLFFYFDLLNMFLFHYRNDKDCLWSPIDYSTFAPVRRHFKAKFRSKHAAKKFQKLFEEVSKNNVYFLSILYNLLR